jgi:hypothetical protein
MQKEFQIGTKYFFNSVAKSQITHYNENGNEKYVTARQQLQLNTTRNKAP